MAAVVEAIAAGAKVPEYAVDVRLVLCLHTLLSDEINAATVDLALTRRDLVRGIDVAGPEQPLGARLDHFVHLFRQAAEHYLPATAHLGETAPEHVHPELFPYLRRIGHGVQTAPSTAPVAGDAPTRHLFRTLPEHLPADRHLYRPGPGA